MFYVILKLNFLWISALELDQTFVLNRSISFPKCWMMKFSNFPENLEIKTPEFRNLYSSSFWWRKFREFIINEAICSTSSRRKPGWRFTAGSTYWCKRNPRPQSTRFIWDMGLFGDVSRYQNQHYMKMCHIENVLCVFHFGWVRARWDHENEISIWVQ